MKAPVGPTPGSAAGALARLIAISNSPHQRIQGDPRGPGGPPHCTNAGDRR